MLTQCQSLLIEFLIETSEIPLVLSTLQYAKSGCQGDAHRSFSYVIGCHLSSVHKASKSARHETKAVKRHCPANKVNKYVRQMHALRGLSRRLSRPAQDLLVFRL